MKDINNIAARLHELTAKELLDILENGMEVVTKDGEVIRARPNAAMLNTIRQFLKDNGVGFADTPDDDPFIKGIKGRLPDFNDDFDSEVTY